MRYGNKTRLPAQVSQWLNPQQNLIWFGQAVQTASLTSTASATPHTKGAYVEAIASTTSFADMVMITVSNGASGVATEGFGDLAIGASASETVIVENFVSGEIIDTSGLRPTHIFPVTIPSGSRVSFRTQNVTASRNTSIVVALYYTGLPSGSKIVGLNEDTATSTSTVVSSNDTWTELVSATTDSYKAIIAWPQSSTNNTGAGTNVTMTLGIGSSGSEVVVGSTFVTFGANETCAVSTSGNPIIYWPQTPITAGSRIAGKFSVGASTRHIAVWGVL